MEEKKKNFFMKTFDDISEKIKEGSAERAHKDFIEDLFSKQNGVITLTVERGEGAINFIKSVVTIRKVPCFVLDDRIKTFVDLDINKINCLRDANGNFYYLKKKLITPESFPLEFDGKTESISLISYMYVDELEKKPAVQVVNNEYITNHVDKSKLVNKGVIGEGNTQVIDKTVEIKTNIAHTIIKKDKE